MTALPRIDGAARRARLVVRQHLARTAADAAEAVAGVAAMHSSDPVTPYLAAWARVPGFVTADLDRALYETRELWRRHAMRRTLFLIPTSDGAAYQAGACARYAARERRRIEQWLAAELADGDAGRWLAQTEAEAVAALSRHGAPLRTQDLTRRVPQLATEITLGSGRWTTRAPVSSRVLFLLAVDGRIVRTAPAGTWRSSQYHWALTAQWFEHAPPPMAAASGRAALARRYLRAFGPATVLDIAWWTGWTRTQTTAALDAVQAQRVRLDEGPDGFVLPDDLRPAQVAAGSPSVALLPGLDPTPMGWKQRDWYLGEHSDQLFDRNGNVGPSVWVDGRIVGGWAQRADGEVVHRLLEDVGAEAAAAVAAEAAALGVWLDGVTVSTRFPVPLQRELSR